ncbi:MAG: SufE family protein [Candidatus Neomarinimicrobiota bacterium]|nr:SufE family protein [Candidatus Neomarinimicrobiota bacterium]
MTIQDTLQELNELFSIFEDPKEKFIQLMDMAKESEGLSESERTEENKVYGCTSQAWVLMDKQEDRTFYFRADSDAMIVKGLLTLLVKIFNGQTASEIRSVDGSVILKSIGLLGAVSNQRTNGFSSAVEKIRQLAS